MESIQQRHPDVYDIINKEYFRQKDGIELIASENFVSSSVLEALGSVMTNKYSEGQPGKRYYGGNVYIDEMELLCKKKALELFKLDSNEWSVNVQPYSGSPANFAVYTALLDPHDRIMGLDLPSGGHLTHGYFNDKKKVSATSIYFESLPYEINSQGYIDYDELYHRAKLFKPKLIIAGGSAYPRDWDYERMSKIAKEVGAYLMTDMAHIAGLVATENANDPFLYSDIVTTTTHKSLRGPRSGMIFSRKEFTDQIDFAVFPSLQGGPHNNVISAVTVALSEALTKDFKGYIDEVKSNAKIVAEELIQLGYKLSTDGTDNHLLLIDLRGKGITGSKAEYILEQVSISVNKNTLKGDKSAFSPGGIRIGLCAMTTRGLRGGDCNEMVHLIHRAIEVGRKIGCIKLSDFKEKVNCLLNEDMDNEEKEIGFELQQLKKDVLWYTNQFHFLNRL